MVHASAVDFLRRSDAKVIAYDVLFTEREGRSESIINGRAITGDDSDRAFVNAVRQAGNVVLLADALYEGQANSAAGPASTRPPDLPGTSYRPGPGFQARPFVRLPFPDLSAAAAAIGHNYLAKDERSDSARRMLPFIDLQGVAVPSLGTAAALKFLEIAADDVRLEGDAEDGGARTDARDPARRRPPYPSRQALPGSWSRCGQGGVLATFPTFVLRRSPSRRTT
jgi:CHASE2 domain-containing sensor protein